MSLDITVRQPETRYQWSGAYEHHYTPRDTHAVVAPSTLAGRP